MKSKMTVEMAKGLADLQRQILTVVHNYVKPGGKLLYSTCTINREENEDNTAWFVENFPEFEKSGKTDAAGKRYGGWILYC